MFKDKLDVVFPVDLLINLIKVKFILKDNYMTKEGEHIIFSISKYWKDDDIKIMLNYLAIIPIFYIRSSISDSSLCSEKHNYHIVLPHSKKLTFDSLSQPGGFVINKMIDYFLSKNPYTTSRNDLVYYIRYIYLPELKTKLS